jgi:hypothetical protein
VRPAVPARLTGEEGLGRQVGVVALSQLPRDIEEPQSAQGVALSQEAVEDGGDQAALNAVGLNHDIGGLYEEDGLE